MKKLTALILTIVALFATIATPISAATESEIIPLYENSKTASTTLSISSSGQATVRIRMSGYSDCEQVTVVTYLERQVGGKWYLVYIGNLENSWEYSTSTFPVYKAYSAQLSTPGTYRVVSEFTVTGTTVETFTKISQSTY